MEYLKSVLSCFLMSLLFFNLYASTMAFDSLKKNNSPLHEIFVSPAGKDSNPGTQKKPLRSIQKAVNNAPAGTTVTLLAGEYVLTAPVILSVKGLSSNWIVLQAAKNAKVVLDGINFDIPDTGSYPRNNGLIQIQHAEYIRIQNIHVRNSHRAGINIQESKHIDVVNCISENSLSPGIAAWQRCEYIRILGNTVMNANNMKMSWMPYKGHEAPHEAISIGGAHYFEVAWNHVYNSEKEGIDIKETAAYGIVHHNYVHNLKRQGLYIDGWFGQLEAIEMYENVVHDCEAGIAISSEDGPNTKNLKIHHNLIYNNRATGLFFSRWGADNSREKIYIYNNTFYRNGWGTNFSGDPQYWLNGGCYLYSTNIKDVDITNNIFARNFPFEIGHTARFGENWMTEKNINISSNLIWDVNKFSYPMYLKTWLKDSVYAITGTHPVTGDPQFIDPGNSDFRLKASSPAAQLQYLAQAKHATNYAGALPPGYGREGFWWAEKFPPLIEIENYGKNEWTDLLNYQDFSNWSVFVLKPEKQGKNENEMQDPPQWLLPKVYLTDNPESSVFEYQFHDGKKVLHISGELLGFLTSKEQYSNYHLKYKFKFGKKWQWLGDRPSDGGIFYHVQHPATNQEKSPHEFNIHDGDIGSYWSFGGYGDIPCKMSSALPQSIKAITPIIRPVIPSLNDSMYLFDIKGEQKQLSSEIPGMQICIANPIADHPVGEWNELDLICLGDTVIHAVNGRVVTVLYNSRHKEGGELLPLNKGAIKIQSEGGEQFVEYIRIKKIHEIPREFRSAVKN